MKLQNLSLYYDNKEWRFRGDKDKPMKSIALSICTRRGVKKGTFMRNGGKHYKNSEHFYATGVKNEASNEV